MLKRQRCRDQQALTNADVTMAAYYDDIAKQYQKSKALPFREYVEWYSYRKLLGNIAGKSVLD